MNTVTLGRTGLAVSRLGFGGLFVNSNAAALAEAAATVSTALANGVNYFDTAPTYFDSEEVLGKVLNERSQAVIFSTKLGGKPEPFDPRDKQCLRRSFERSLQLLKRETIDLLMVHEPDRPQQYDWWTDPLTVEGPVLELLDELKSEGKVRYTGLGGTTTTEMAHLCRSGKFDVVLTAFNYSLLWREAEHEVLAAAKSQGMGIIVGSPLQQGALARCYRETIDSPHAYWLSEARRQQLHELYDYVEETGLPLPELAIRFVLSNPDVHCVLMGARSRAEATQNIASVRKGALPAEVLCRLREIADRVPFRPFGEPVGLGYFLAHPEGYKGQGTL